MRAVLLLAAIVWGCAPRAVEPAPTPRSRPSTRSAPTPAAEPRRSPASLEAMLAEDMAPEQGMPWSATRRLVWRDFKGTPPQGGPEGARTASGLYYAWFCRGEVFGFRATAALHPNRSWVKQMVVDHPRESPRILRHEQTHFDLAEVFARRLRERFADMPAPCAQPDGRLRAIAKQIVDDLKEMQTRYDRETNHGLIDDKQSQWNADVTRMLTASRRYAQ